MNYSKTLNPNLVLNPIQEKCVVHFKLCLDFNGCDYSKGNDRATSDMKTQQ